MSQAQSFDVLIVGGGPVGLTLALALVQSARGIRVGLVDRRPLSVPRDSRASAIAAGVRRVFEALGVWPAMLAAGAADHRHAHHRFRRGRHFPAAVPDLRWRRRAGRGLCPYGAQQRQQPGAARRGGRSDHRSSRRPTIAGYAAEAGEARLVLADGRVLTAPLLVAADGGQSALRGMAGIGVIAHDYGQTGLVTTIAP